MALLCLMLYSLGYFKHVSSRTHVNNTTDHLAFLQGHLKHTPPHFHHMLKGKFEAEKNSGHCLTTRYNVNKMPSFPHPPKVFNQSFVLGTYFITLVWHQTHTWNRGCLPMDILFAWTFLFLLIWSVDSCAWNFALFVSAWNCLCAWKKNHDLKVFKSECLLK